MLPVLNPVLPEPECSKWHMIQSGTGQLSTDSRNSWTPAGRVLTFQQLKVRNLIIGVHRFLHTTFESKQTLFYPVVRKSIWGVNFFFNGDVTGSVTKNLYFLQVCRFLTTQLTCTPLVLGQPSVKQKTWKYTCCPIYILNQ